MHRPRLALTLSAAAAVGIGTAIRRAWRAPLTSSAMPATLPGLMDELQIDLDRWGVPFIRAAHHDDAWAAVGYLHAHDRWASMELMLRCAEGTMEEALGSSMRRHDTAMQTCELRARAHDEWSTLSERAQRDLLSYSRGVQAWLAATPPARRSIETRLGRRPRDTWTPIDSLLVLRLVALGWSSLPGEHLDVCDNIPWDWPGATDDAVLCGDAGSRNAGMSETRTHTLTIGETPRIVGAARELKAAIRGARRMLGTDHPDRGSNAWAVQKRHTSTGGPILAGDCHMELAVPALWHEIGVRCPELSVRGFSIPGVPWVLAGHTGSAAWTMTGCATPQVTGNSDACTAVTDTSTCAESLSRLQRSHTATDVSASLDAWHAPLMHMVWADSNDAIGLRLCGMVPNLALPAAESPPCGWIASANDCAAGRTHPARELLERGAAPGWRAQRIRELLARTTHADVRQHAAIQCDVESVSARELRSVIVDRTTHGHATPRSDPGRRLLAKLRAWDGRMDPNSPGAAASAALTDIIFMLVAGHHHRHGPVPAGDLAGRVIGAEASAHATPTASQALMIFHHAISRADETRTSRMCERAGVAHDIDELIAWLLDSAAQRLPADPAAWTLGTARTTRIRHRWMRLGKLGRIPGLNRAASPGIAVMPGGCDTPWLTTGHDGASIGPVFRMVIDLADPDRSMAVLAGGQSGHSASGHATDQLPLWIRGDTRPMPWSDAAIDESSVSQMTISPATSAQAETTT